MTLRFDFLCSFSMIWRKPLKFSFNHVKRTQAGRYPSFSSPLSDHWIPSPCSGPETAARLWPLKISSFCVCSIQSFCTDRHMVEVQDLRSDLMNEEYNYTDTPSMQRWRLLQVIAARDRACENYLFGPVVKIMSNDRYFNKQKITNICMILKLGWIDCHTLVSYLYDSKAWVD